MNINGFLPLKRVFISKVQRWTLDIFLYLVAFVRRSVPFSLEGNIVVTFAKNWSQSKYVVSDPRTVWPECVYKSEGLVCIRSEGLVA